MQSLRLVMVLKTVSLIGLLRIHGVLHGVTVGTSKWRWARTCAVSLLEISISRNTQPAYRFKS